MPSTAFALWGLTHGPLSDSAGTTRQGPIVGVFNGQIFDSSNVARTPDQRTKTITLSNPQASAANIYIGGAGVGPTAHSIELLPGAPAAVIEVREQGLRSFHADVLAGATLVISQLG